MGTFHRPLRSSRKVWLAISITLFVACWFLRGGKGGDEPIGEIWWVFITGDYICSVPEMLIPVGFFTFVFAAVAALIGWILQFIVCMALDYFHKSKPADAPPDMK
jgi:hypothetical protein